MRRLKEIVGNRTSTGTERKGLLRSKGLLGERGLKKLTLLHSNDMHGDFMADEVDSELVGGVSMLSGYLNKVRHEEENVVYAIAGDMFIGSLIDSEYRGLSTIQIMNLLAPDVATIGNHEVDYGIGHMLFLERCADFPIVNVNMRTTTNHERLFDPFYILEIGGMRILFIGVVTERIVAQCKSVEYDGSFVTVEDPVREIGRICNAYGSLDIDLTVLLTHIGFEEDKELAAKLDPAWGVDIIVGGHSHTLLDEPAVVNGIPIVQVGVGTSHVGRFDITIDTNQNCIHSYTWEVVPIDSTHCPVDEDLENYILDCKESIDEKYSQVLVRLDRRLTHPTRTRETEIGDLFSDILCDALGTDVFLVASGSIRGEELGSIVTKGDLAVCFPYDDSVHVVYMTGAQLKHALLHILRDDTFGAACTEFFQVSRGIYVEYDQPSHSLVRLEYEGEPIEDDSLFSVGVQHYFFENLGYSFDLTLDELEENGPTRVATTSCTDVIEEALLGGEYRDAKGEGRIVLHLSDAQ